MIKNQPALEEWREVYRFAIQVKKIAPWEWITEADIFGVQNPETDEIGFVSVMGMAGKHYALAVYMGPEGLYGFLDLQNVDPIEIPELVLEIPQLQASFENRDVLNKKDHEIIKKLGLKFRGPHAWPMFRSYHPGFFPWFLEADEARFIMYVLEQTLDVASRYKEDQSLLEYSDEERFLVRVPHKEDGTLVWEDRIMRVPPPESPHIPIAMNDQEIKTLKSLPQGIHTIEIDFFMFPAKIGEKGTRPFYSYMLLSVDARSYLVLGSELMTVDPSLEAMWGSIPMKVVHQLLKAGMLPREIRVRSELLLQLLQPLAGQLRFNLKLSRNLRSLDSAKESLFQYFGR
ncbi:MAG TPA: hypothetical protein VM123_00305 [archaeon]|nr:hypothetical protein [archaeon]